MDILSSIQEICLSNKDCHLEFGICNILMLFIQKTTLQKNKKPRVENQKNKKQQAERKNKSLKAQRPNGLYM